MEAERQDAIICDLDGTLASVEWRRHHVPDGPCSRCKGAKTIIVSVGSGRPEKCPKCGGRGAPKKDWIKFLNGLNADAPVPSVLAILSLIHQQNERLVELRSALIDNRPYESEEDFRSFTEKKFPPGWGQVAILLTSGRPAAWEYPTWWWLNEHEVPYTELLMREQGDSRPDDIVKTEIYKKKIEPRYNTLFAVDDRPMIVKAWQALTIPVIHVTDPGLPPIFEEVDTWERDW